MICGGQPKLGSTEHLSRVFGRAIVERVPVCGGLDLTYRCNFRCRHCYVGHLTGQRRSEAAELTTAQILDLLEQAAGAGCLLLLLSGGEPLLRHDFPDIYVGAKRLGMIVTVFTNGSLIDERHLDLFEHYPPHEVEVSVYGASEPTYARVTGVPGAYSRVGQALDGLLDRGIPVSIKSMILRDNAHEITALRDLAGALGVDFRVDPLVVPRLDGDPAPLEQRVDPQRAVEIELQLDHYRESLETFCQKHLVHPEEDALPADRLYRCGAGVASFHIDARGFLHPCLMSPIAYNTQTMGFAKAWEAVTAAVDESTWEGVGGCAKCPKILLCGYCPGLFALEQASPAHPPAYVCALGASRCEALAHELPGVVCVNSK